jgi:DNA-binding NarL/FixJ family response regulator
VLKQSFELLEDCITDTRTISDLVQSRMEGGTSENSHSERAFAAESSSVGEEGSSLPVAKQEANSFAKRLSPREHEVIRLLAGSKSNKEIAAKLGISVRTVETHRARIMLKLSLHSLTELVRYAVRNHIIEA